MCENIQHVEYILHLRYDGIHTAIDRWLLPVVHGPEKLQIVLVDAAADLLAVILHQLCVVHQFLLGGDTEC